MNKKIHLGCGKRYLDGYIHVDIHPHSHVDFVSSIDKLDMFHDGCANIIYASHCIEYFDRDEIIEVLIEWRRVLAPGGTLRLAVPNFKALTEVYKETNDLNKVLGPLYGKWNVGKKEFIYHKTVYDLESLSSLLKQVGFNQIKEWDWKDTFINQPDFDDHSQAYYPHMDKENGILISLNIEGTKPSITKNGNLK